MEPIAIIGAGMRLPGGVKDLAGFAAMLFDKADAVREVPPERWPVGDFYDPEIGTPGKSRARHAALLDRLDLFDAEFFGIAPREAERLDPIQRLVLEVGWEAVEHAGIDPLSLAGTMTGVYMGLGPSDYGHDLLRNTATLDPYTATGIAYGTAVGRLSYFLDLLGPAIALDTGCSGSLISLHLAAQALRHGDCDLALAGGANVILSPELGVIYSKARMLAPDGRCRTFSADAQGFVRGEGCGIVVLRRLADALSHGDRILGIIRGSATNQDGRSAGLTAPRGSSQEAVINAALKAAQVAPDDVDFVEAHGTGTPLGDPVEVASLGAVFCNDRPADRPLVVGAVKTNIGHLESSAGIAGLLKLLVAFEHEAIPANLHFAEPNPFIEWDRLALTVPVETLSWRRGDRTRFAGVSSFGFGGSNVHLVLEEPPARAEPRCEAETAWILPIAARSPKALAALAQDYIAVLASEPLASVCQTAATARAHFGCRVAVVARTAADMTERLSDAIARIDARAGSRAAPVVDFVVSAPTQNDASIAAGLIADYPAFAILWEQASATMTSVGSGALALALAALWRSLGVTPRAVNAAPGSEAQAEPVVQSLAADNPGGEDVSTEPAAIVIELGGLPENGAWEAVLQDLARLYVAGAAIDWAVLYRKTRRAPVTLPAYPFERRRHWSPQLRAFSRMQDADAAAQLQAPLPLIESLAKAPAARRLDLILRRLRALFVSIQHINAGPLSLTSDFRSAGIDPMSPDVLDQIEGAFGARLPPTLLLNNRNLGELSQFLLARAEQSNAPTTTPLAQAAMDNADLKARLSSRLAALR